MKKRLVFGVLSSVLFGVEVLIGMYAHGWVRSYLGDVLIVILLYTQFRTAFPEWPRRWWLLPTAILLFSFAVEFLQLWGFCDRFGITNRLMRIVLGTGYSTIDLACYAIGIVPCFIAEYVMSRKKNEVTGETMGTKRVYVAPYDAQWKMDFDAIRAELADALGGLALRIEHVGSTSVEGLSAKPIIDIDVVIESGEKLPAVIASLAGIGYCHEGNLGIVGREAFKYEGKEHLRRHHLYVCTQNSPELRRHLAFRDYLRTHPEAVEAYSRIKEEGAALYPDDIDAYIAHKSPLIEELYEKIGL